MENENDWFGNLVGSFIMMRIGWVLTGEYVFHYPLRLYFDMLWGLLFGNEYLYDFYNSMTFWGGPEGVGLWPPLATSYSVKFG